MATQVLVNDSFMCLTACGSPVVVEDGKTGPDVPGHAKAPTDHGSIGAVVYLGKRLLLWLPSEPTPYKLIERFPQTPYCLGMLTFPWGSVGCEASPIPCEIA